MIKQIVLIFDQYNYRLISEKITNRQLALLDEIISNNNLHLESQLGTCEITGLILLGNKSIYLTCGSSQIVVYKQGRTNIILLNKKGSNQLFKLVTDIRNQH